jgi:hypothetical protein
MRETYAEILERRSAMNAAGRGKGPGSRVAGPAKKPGGGGRQVRARAGYALGPKVDPAAEEYTVVICGPVLGASFPAAVIAQKLGLDFSRHVDAKLGDARFAGKSADELRALVRERDAKSAVWAWKAGVGADLRAVLPLLRNPRVVYMWRDPISSAPAKTKQNLDPLQVIRSTLDLLDYLKSAGCPTMLYSLDTSRRKPRKFIRSLAAFVGKPFPEKPGPLVKLLKQASPAKQVKARRSPT